MSEIKTNKLTGTSTAGSILVTGEGNSTTTNLQQGLAKAWIQHNAGTAITNSLNYASILDVGTGNYRPNYTNNMANNDNITINILPMLISDTLNLFNGKSCESIVESDKSCESAVDIKAASAPTITKA